VLESRRRRARSQAGVSGSELSGEAGVAVGACCCSDGERVLLVAKPGGRRRSGATPCGWRRRIGRDA
jgi:hypothetical protein